MTEGLYADAIATLAGWTAMSLQADKARRRTLALLLTDGLATVDRAHRAGHLTASTMVLDPAGRMLLCLHRRLNLWMQVGGHCELADTTLAAAALRRRLRSRASPAWSSFPSRSTSMFTRRAAARLTAEPATATLHFDVRFVALPPVGAVEQLSEESQALGWFTPDELPAPLATGVRSQIAPAFAVLGALRSTIVLG